MAIRQQHDKDINFTKDVALGDGTPVNVSDIAADIEVRSVTLVRGTEETQWDVSNVIVDQNPTDPVGRYNFALPASAFNVPLEDDDRIEIAGVIRTSSGDSPFNEEFFIYDPSADIFEVTITNGPFAPGQQIAPTVIAEVTARDLSSVRISERSLIRADGTQVVLDPLAYNPTGQVTSSGASGFVIFNSASGLEDSDSNTVVPANNDTLTLEFIAGTKSVMRAVQFKSELALGPIVT